MRPRLEVADVIRACQAELQAACSAQQRKAMRAILACRTALLGGHLRRCERCAHELIAYNSCRNRHCPKCQAARQADWCEAQAQQLLNVPYCHLVFTLPRALAPLALQNQRLMYNLLFRAAAETLTTIARDPRHLGAQIGFIAVLHTWGQTLTHHPHLHCLAPAGGLAPDQHSWIPCKKQFFLPVRVLSRLYRHKYLSYLRDARQQQQLAYHGQLAPLTRARAWQRYLDGLYASDWVVYAKPAFGSPQQTLKYLARYTHRVAISNARLLRLHDDHVTFAYKDYRQPRARRRITLSSREFCRRYLQHVLPKGFVRIRHYGLLANRQRQHKLARCQYLIGAPAPTTSPPPDPSTYPCPACRTGQLVRLTNRTLPARPPEARMNSPTTA